MSEPREVGRTVIEYLRKFPGKKSHTIAKLISEKHPELGTAEQIRGVIRYYRGSMGLGHIAELSTEEFLNQPYKAKIESDEEIIKQIIHSKKVVKA
jgi:hypothetical protein